MIFNGEEAKFIAEYYITNYKILSNSASGEKINERRNAKITELTNEINSRRTTPVTEAQVRQKIQDLKRTSKEKNVTNKKVRKPTGGGRDKTKRLSAAQEIMVARLGNTSAYRGIPGRGLESGLLDVLEESQSEDSNSEDGNDQDGQSDRSQPMQQSQLTQQSQQQRPPMSIEIRQSRPSSISMPQLSPILRSALDDAPGPSSRNPSHVAKGRASRPQRRNAMAELDDEKKAILQLQKVTLEVQKQLSLAQLKATHEFRCFILEKRMIIRGANIDNSPLDVDDDLLEHRASLMP